MSSHTTVDVTISAIGSLIQALRDLNAQQKELKKMRSGEGTIEQVDVVVTDPNGRDIGFQKTAKGDYQVICDSQGLSPEQQKKQQAFVKQIRQRYSYNKVLEQLKKQGYIIAEEEKDKNNSIRILARKWS